MEQITNDAKDAIERIENLARLEKEQRGQFDQEKSLYKDQKRMYPLHSF